MTNEADQLAGYQLAKQVKELATWLGNAPGWVQVPDHIFDSLDELAALAMTQLGLIIPEGDEYEDDDPIQIVCDWLAEWDTYHDPIEQAEQTQHI